MPTISITVGVISGLIVYIIFRKKNLSEKIVGAVVLVVLGNTAFLGFPMNLGVFGQSGLLRAIFMIWVL